jgi:hypothetical protein
MPKSSPDLADQLIERLNELCDNDDALAVLSRLCDKRVVAPKGTFPLQDEHDAVGLLHVLNAVAGVDEKGHGLIAIVLTEQGHATGFQRYKAPSDLAVVKPAGEREEEPTKAETPGAKKSNPPPSR